ncbi:rhomboid-like protein [Actinoplanes sp. NPDC051859]|uniref:rhomboid-like protein n=1 Tax=Actinoplanes sp. NPDC051859 TaxID=3363909 RepID=UPI0037BCDE5B
MIGLLRAVRQYPRRAPLTFAYVILLFAGHIVVKNWLHPETEAELYRYISTNLENLQDHPITTLFGSLLFFDGTLTPDLSDSDSVLYFVGTFFTLGLGVCCFLAWAESRWGTLRAYAMFIGAHVVTTLVVAVVIVVALENSWYPPEVRQSTDYGISYGAQAVSALGILALPLWARIPWGLWVLTSPLIGLTWVGPLPDFSTIGHILAAIFGFALAAVLTSAQRRARIAARASDEAHHSASSSLT